MFAMMGGLHFREQEVLPSLLCLARYTLMVLYLLIFSRSTYLIRDNILSLPGTQGTVPTLGPYPGTVPNRYSIRDSPYYPKVGTVPTIPGTVP